MPFNLQSKRTNIFTNGVWQAAAWQKSREWKKIVRKLAESRKALANIKNKKKYYKKSYILIFVHLFSF